MLKPSLSVPAELPLEVVTEVLVSRDPREQEISELPEECCDEEDGWDEEPAQDEGAIESERSLVPRVLQYMQTVEERVGRIPVLVGSSLAMVLLCLSIIVPFSDETAGPGGKVLSARLLQRRWIVSPGASIQEDEAGEAAAEVTDSDTDEELSPAPSALSRIVQLFKPRPSAPRVRTVSTASMGALAYNRAAPVKMTQSLNTRKVTEQVLRVISRHGKRGVNKPMLAASIVAEARRQSYDPLFVAAVIKSESGFDSIAQSGVGARGLMQLMPGTAKYVEDMKPDDLSKRGDLTDPGHNLKLGIRYLKHLEEMYGGNRVLTLMAYNWGPGHVEKTVKGGQGRGVPKPVVNYALKILSDHSRWVKEIAADPHSPKAKV